MTDLSSCTILIVDDTEANLDILVDTLGEEYEVSVAMDGKAALQVVEEDKPDLILLDIMMPGIDGYEVCKRLKAAESSREIPIIFLTAMVEEQDEARGLALGAVDYVAKPFSPELVKSRVKNQLELKMHRDHLEILVKERTRQLELTQEVTLESMGTLAEYRDPETGGHIKRTQQYVKLMAKFLQNSPEHGQYFDDYTVELLYKSAPLHDVGKVGVRDEILLKPGKLTADEFEEMKKHTVYGRETIEIAERKLGRDSFLHYAREIAESHHEKWDGSGYPYGLEGNDISVYGRVMAIADVYDALISKRVYKPSFPHKKAVQIIKEGSGNHFDPDMVEAFLALQDDFRQVALEFADFEEERENLRNITDD